MKVSPVPYLIRTLQDEADAQRIVDFYFSGDSFDDSRHTPGEISHYRNNPFQCLREPEDGIYYWFIENDRGEIIAVNSLVENEQKTGGYVWDYITVHKHYREGGIASTLIDTMLDFIRLKKGRYVLTYTCDLNEYQPIQRLFRKKGFQQIAYCPDYYFEGESRIVYYRKIE